LQSAIKTIAFRKNIVKDLNEKGGKLSNHPLHSDGEHRRGTIGVAGMSLQLFLAVPRKHKWKHNETEDRRPATTGAGKRTFVFFAWHHLANHPNWQKIVA
jgi:hypothetical protein